jgi:flagellar motor switch protein FliN/FliY
MSDPELSPLDDLPGLTDEEPGAESLEPLGGPDALDEAIAELQGVIDKDSDMGPLGGDLDMDGDDVSAPEHPADAGLQGLVMSIPVQLDVIIGSAEMPVADLMGMDAGSVVSLNRKIGESVDICVNGTKIATGEIQSLEDDPSRLGVKILSLEKS